MHLIIFLELVKLYFSRHFYFSFQYHCQIIVHNSLCLNSDLYVDIFPFLFIIFLLLQYSLDQSCWSGLSTLLAVLKRNDPWIVHLHFINFPSCLTSAKYKPVSEGDRTWVNFLPIILTTSSSYCHPIPCFWTLCTSYLPQQYLVLPVPEHVIL